MSAIAQVPAAVQFVVAAAIAVALLAFGVWAVRSGRGCTGRRDTGAPKSAAMDTPEHRGHHHVTRRRLRAGPPMIQGPDGLATLTPLPPQQCAAIARMAQSCATVDFRQVGRPSANPYSRHTRAHTVYAIEYAAKWEELEFHFGSVT